MSQQLAFDFAAPAATSIKAVPSNTTEHQASEDMPTLKRRVYTTGHRHGKAFGNVGVVTTQYSKGFAEGFMSAFKQ